MYKFSNGLVFFTKEDADKAISAGHKLLIEKEHQKEVINTSEESNLDEIDNITNEFVEETNRDFKKTSKKNKTSI